MYSNLLNGSQNHLRAFVSTLLKQTGVTYEPGYMSQDAYEIVINSGTAGGGSGKGGGRRG